MALYGPTCPIGVSRPFPDSKGIGFHAGRFRGYFLEGLAVHASPTVLGDAPANFRKYLREGPVSASSRSTREASVGRPMPTK